MRPKVSVIIPFYNAAAYIERCVTCLINQTFQNIEFIFVNDCSTDNSVQIIQNHIDINKIFGEKTRIIHHQKNAGTATARNSGINAAQGIYIAWLDSDDWVEDDAFQKMYIFAEESNAEIIWTDYSNNYESHEDVICQKVTTNKYVVIESLMKGKLFGGMVNKLVKKELYDNNNIQFPDGLNMCEDLRVSIQLFYYAEKIAYLPKSFYHYVKYNTASISTVSMTNPRVNNEWIENVKGIIRFLEDKRIKGLDEPIAFMKLSTKKNLLIRGNNLEIFNQWNNIFPEVNSFVWKTHLPLYYKLLAYTIDKRYWMLTKVLINIKLFIKKK